MMDAFMAAQNLADFTPSAEAAKAICIIRMQGPYDYAQTPWGMLPRWQAIVLEGLLLGAIARG